jgi:hypothetical protein
MKRHVGWLVGTGCCAASIGGGGGYFAIQFDSEGKQKALLFMVRPK